MNTYIVLDTHNMLRREPLSDLMSSELSEQIHKKLEDYLRVNNEQVTYVATGRVRDRFCATCILQRVEEKVEIEITVGRYRAYTFDLDTKTGVYEEVLVRLNSNKIHERVG